MRYYITFGNLTTTTNVKPPCMFWGGNIQVPDQIEAHRAEFWRTWGVPGQLTSVGNKNNNKKKKNYNKQTNKTNQTKQKKGRSELQSLGAFARARYIINEPLLPNIFDQNLFYARASSRIPRTLMSPEAAMSTLYPSSPVPIYSYAPEEDMLLLPVFFFYK